MGRVSDDHVRLGNRLHHARSGTLLLNAAQTTLDLRISLRLLVFVLDLLLGHPQVLFVFIPLVHIVCRGKKDENHARFKNDLHDDVAHPAHRAEKFHIHHTRDSENLAFYDGVDDIYEDNDFKQGFEQLNNAAHGEHFLKALQWVDALSLEFERLWRNQKLSLSHCCKRCNNAADKKRQNRCFCKDYYAVNKVVS